MICCRYSVRQRNVLNRYFGQGGILLSDIPGFAVDCFDSTLLISSSISWNSSAPVFLRSKGNQLFRISTRMSDIEDSSLLAARSRDFRSSFGSRKVIRESFLALGLYGSAILLPSLIGLLFSSCGVFHNIGVSITSEELWIRQTTVGEIFEGRCQEAWRDL